MSENFKNKKEEEALNYLEKNFISNEDNSLDSVQKVDLSYLDTAPSNEYLTIPLNILPCGLFYKLGTKISIRAAKSTRSSSLFCSRG